ncbi:hypothetical protein QQ045_020941 [Rhodiola kirilowii]
MTSSSMTLAAFTTSMPSTTFVLHVPCFTDDPLYVNSVENITDSLVTQPLVGDKNYLNWRKSMEMALCIKMKLGFVREECFSGSNDFTIFSIQHEIAFLMQEDKSIAQYYNKLVQLWGDEDALTEDIACELGSRCKATRCSNDRKLRDRRTKFLLGLDDVYTTTMSNILQMRPSPSLKECYKQLIQEENQRKSKNSSIPEMKSLFCTHCQLQGHVKETCYKLHGYPTGYKFTNKEANTNRGNSRVMANNVTTDMSSVGTNDKELAASPEVSSVPISSL